MKNQVSFCANLILEKTPDFRPQIGLVLGSGLGTFADSVEVISKTSFKELPGFPKAGVGGHALPHLHSSAQVQLEVQREDLPGDLAVSLPREHKGPPLR